jgi:hypothetical protein
MRPLSCLALSLVCYLTAGALLAQTSPKGTLKIESSTKEGEPDSGETTSDFVVSTSDPSARELLNEHPAENGMVYFISPDEKWIFATIHFGSHMGGGQLFKRGDGLKFEPVKPESLAELAWRFFAQQEHMEPDDVPYRQGDEGIIDFVAWSPDSARLLVVGYIVLSSRYQASYQKDSDTLQQMLKTFAYLPIAVGPTRDTESIGRRWCM